MTYIETTGPTLGLLPGIVDSGVTRDQLIRAMHHFTAVWRRTYLRSTGRSHLDSRDWDAWGHCWIACEAARRYGLMEAGMAGTIRELGREMGIGGPHDSLRQDLHNQEVGLELALQSGRPSVLTDRAFRHGRLDLTAPITGRMFTLELGEHNRPGSAAAARQERRERRAAPERF